MMEGEGSSLDDLMAMGQDDEAFEVVDVTNKYTLCDNTKARGQQLKNGDTLILRTVSDISTTTDSAVAAEVGQHKSSKPAVAPKSNVPTSTRCVKKRRRDICCDATTKRHKMDLHRQRLPDTGQRSRIKSSSRRRPTFSRRVLCLMKASCIQRARGTGTSSWPVDRSTLNSTVMT